MHKCWQYGKVQQMYYVMILLELWWRNKININRFNRLLVILYNAFNMLSKDIYDKCRERDIDNVRFINVNKRIMFAYIELFKDLN